MSKFDSVPESQEPNIKSFTFTIPVPHRSTPTEKDTHHACRVKREPKKRVITSTVRWNKYKDNLAPEDKSVDECLQNAFVASQIQAKLGGYKHQDVKKGRYVPEEFVGRETIGELLRDGGGRCVYCGEAVQLIYENVREPKQWTLDRIDNSLGHNRGNLVISCLACNLRRRCIHSAKYAFTKQLEHLVLID
jgi:hypothetical protein